VQLVDGLRRGDESAFVDLVRKHHPSMLQVAQFYVPSRAVAEEVVQETWLGVLRGLHRFEGRSSLKTWIFQILVNRAKSRGQRELRTFASFSLSGEDWSAAGGVPRAMIDLWHEGTSEQIILNELGARIQLAIDGLRPQQRAVIALRCLEGRSADEVCRILGLSDANQRVLLHRARRAVRRALEPYLSEDQA
jgi:RNA polymerase sigma-70 factor (ECF subfamily)